MAAAHGRERGGILTLLALIEEHEPAFAYDWRTRFHQSLQVIETGVMSWREAWQLTTRLLIDPSSRVFAAVAGWSHPWTREAFVLADLYDLLAAAHAGRHRRQLEPYPRPGQEYRVGQRMGTAIRPQSEIREGLTRRGHR